MGPASVPDHLSPALDAVVSRFAGMVRNVGWRHRLSEADVDEAVDLLGRAVPPTFAHHALVRRPDGSKLSKSAGDTGVRELRAQGLSPDDVIGLAAAAIGLIASPRAIRSSDVPSLFL